MKRSDMELLIAECLIEPHSDDPLKEASYILKRLQDHGMMPPFNYDKFYKSWRIGGNGYEWDEEDEK